MNLNHYSFHDDHSPLKIKVYNFISSEINNSQLKVGNYLPSIRTFAETLGGSCHVIHIAIRELANQGILSQCENGRYIVSCKDAPIARKHCRIAVCSHGHQVIRHSMYQGIFNQLQKKKRPDYELDCLLSLEYEQEKSLPATMTFCCPAIGFPLTPNAFAKEKSSALISGRI